MGIIHQLSDDIINKIAAGEVVERPASVVKELVENALDAGASHVTIDIRDGGKSYISVADDGGGIAADDAMLAVQRHATSKIARVDDLFAIHTMGFRGEALASIAAVSRFSITSRTTAADEGFLLDATQGAWHTTPRPRPRGTTVIAEDLFYNVPARKAFLKASATEAAAILELIQAFAIAHLDAGFTLRHNQKDLLHAEAEPNPEHDAEDALRRRVRAVYGAEIADTLIYVKKDQEAVAVEGLISPPGVEKTTGKYLHLFVNRRYVKDKNLRFAVTRGYHSHLLKGKLPVAFLKLQIDPSLVDVNVHPAKTELRFQYLNDVQNALAMAIRDEIRQGAWAKPDSLSEATSYAPPPATPTTPSTWREHGATSVSSPASATSFSTASTSVSHQVSSSRSESFKASAPASSPPRADMMSFRAKSQASPGPRAWSDRSITVSSPDGDQSHGAASVETSPAGLSAFWEPTMNLPDTGEQGTIPWHELNYLGTFARLYLLFTHHDRLLVVDQHAFHERILFEQFYGDPSILETSQALLMPEVLRLPPAHISRLAEQAPALRRLGFAYEILDEEHVELRALPLLLAKRDGEAIMSALADPDAQHGGGAIEAQQGVFTPLLATMACHAAVRKGEELTHDEISRLVKDAEGVDFYHNCPHGRPVFKWWREGEVARWFER